MAPWRSWTLARGLGAEELSTTPRARPHPATPPPRLARPRPPPRPRGTSVLPFPLPEPPPSCCLLTLYLPLPPGHVARGYGREALHLPPSHASASGQTGSSRPRDSDTRLPPGGRPVANAPGHARPRRPFPARREARPPPAAISASPAGGGRSGPRGDCGDASHS